MQNSFPISPTYSWMAKTSSWTEDRSRRPAQYWAMVSLHSGKASCWINGPQWLQADLPYPHACWRTLAFAVPFPLPRHIAFLFWTYSRERHTKWLQHENMFCSQKWVVMFSFSLPLHWQSIFFPEHFFWNIPYGTNGVSFLLQLDLLAVWPSGGKRWKQAAPTH